MNQISSREAGGFSQHTVYTILPSKEEKLELLSHGCTSQLEVNPFKTHYIWSD